MSLQNTVDDALQPERTHKIPVPSLLRAVACPEADGQVHCRVSLVWMVYIILEGLMQRIGHIKRTERLRMLQ